MATMILENISGKKLTILIINLIVCQIACFLIGGLVTSYPASTQVFLSTVCLDDHPDTECLNCWLTPKCRRIVDLHEPGSVEGLNANNFVFVIKMPSCGKKFSRWQQSLVGVLQVDVVYRPRAAISNVFELEIHSKLAYRNKKCSKWTHYASANVKRLMECKFDNHCTNNGYFFNCTTLPLFELSSLHYDHYLLNIKLPVEDERKNQYVENISDIYLRMVYMNEDFIKILFSMKAIFFPVTVGMILWFCQRIYMLQRYPVLLEYMLIIVSGAMAFLNMPIEFFTLRFQMPYTSLFNDFRWGLFYTALLSFWLVFANEHMVIQKNPEKNTLRIYWPYVSGISACCMVLLTVDFCERIVQVYNPFVSIWTEPVNKYVAITFLSLAGILIGAYFALLYYMMWKVFENLNIYRDYMSCASFVHRLYYKGVIYRFNSLLFVTVICVTIAVISLILSQLRKEHTMKLNIPSALVIGAYGMWNIYIWSLLILCAPSRKIISVCQQPLLDQSCSCGSGSVNFCTQTEILEPECPECMSIQPQEGHMLMAHMLCVLYYVAKGKPFCFGKQNNTQVVKGK